MTQPDLAAAAGLGLSTIVDFERERRAVSTESVHAIRAAFEAAGVEFIKAGVRLRVEEPSCFDESEKGRDVPD